MTLCNLVNRMIRELYRWTAALNCIYYNCTFYTKYQLPCRHLIYLAVANNTLPELRGNSR